MVRDGLNRPAGSLRLSVTDRCNLRCQYCMPEAHYTWLPRPDILKVDELDRLVRVFTQVGVARVRLTGGEPLLRPDLPDLLARLAQNPRIRDLALTTNGVLLAGQAARLHAAGLHRLTVSLDTLRPARFQALTRFAQHAAVLRGIAAAAALPFASLKLDTVVIRGVNDDELVDLLEFAKGHHAEIRFIEYMDVGGATRWSMEAVVTRQEILRRLHAHYGDRRPGRALPSARRDALRHYRIDDDAVLPPLRSEPADRRRHLAALPLRHPGHGSAEPAAPGRVRPRAPGADRVGLAGAP
jgi:cyclic pyranopterin phosphate synthase